MLTNHAAYLTAKETSPLEIREAPYSLPATNEIVIRVRAIAVNPVDAIIQTKELWPLTYPQILGCDIAGSVVEIGDSVTRFKTNDRVIGFAQGGLDDNTKTAGFQEYVVLPTNLVCEIPNDLSFEQACVIPLTFSTMSAALYLQDLMALPYPSESPKETGTTLLVWGASTALGLQAMQLARASGVEIVATASEKNFGLVKNFGAAQVLDYKSPQIVDELIRALTGKTVVGAIPCAGAGQEIQACVDVIAKCKGKKLIVSPLPELPDTLPPSMKAKFVFGNMLKDSEVADVVYKDFLPKALANGKFVPAPEADVVGKGLEDLQKALNIRRDSQISARKIVVTM